MIYQVIDVHNEVYAEFRDYSLALQRCRGLGQVGVKYYTIRCDEG